MACERFTSDEKFTLGEFWPRSVKVHQEVHEVVGGLVGGAHLLGASPVAVVGKSYIEG